MAEVDEWKERQTLGQMLNNAAAKFGGREAWVFKDERVTYGQLRERVDQLAGGLTRLGVKRGDKVSLWMPNCMEWIYSYFAVAKIGAALVPVNTRFKTHETAYIVGQSDSNTLIMSDRFLNIDYVGMVRELCPELEHTQPGKLHAERLPELRNVICLSDKRYDGMYGFDEVYALGQGFPSDELSRIESAVDPDDVVIMVYTSGTTGFPKGVMHSHKIIHNMADAGERLGMTPDDCVVIFLPMFHVYAAFATVIMYTYYGAKAVMMDSFDPGEAMRLTEKEKATVCYGMDTSFFDQLNHPDFGKYDLSSLRTGVCPSGAPNLIPLIKDVMARMCKDIRGVYGMTECTSMTALTCNGDPPERVFNTSGKPLPGFQIKVVDPETNETLPPYTTGEVCAKGHPVMLGYYKKPEETAKAIDPDGWFHTGDLGMLDDLGYIRFMGRWKDMFKVGGENADPVEIEALLLQHPAILMARVTGVPDKRLSEVCAAFVQFKPGMHATADEIVGFCKGKIANFKVPRYVLEIDEYPMTASGKVQKFKLRDIAVQRLGLEA